MFRSVFHSCKKTYLNTLPMMVAFSGTSGLLTAIRDYPSHAIEAENRNTEISVYPYLLGYISLGILTGIAYPISFPLSLYYVCKIL